LFKLAVVASAQIALDPLCTSIVIIPVPIVAGAALQYIIFYQESGKGISAFWEDMRIIEDGAVSQEGANTTVVETAEGHGFQEAGEAINDFLALTLWLYRCSSQPAFFLMPPA
jgi:hypothetical protein